jgi:TolB-like protein/DNA-binding winged helix-turn-helix (wHTH) protein/Flp pilus assembly protein TadD
MQKLQHETLSFDGFILDLTRGRLLRGTEEVKLRPKSFEVLKHLVENSDRLVNKAELMQAVWPDSFVTDDSVAQCLIEIRRALGDHPHRYIKTIPRRGYIFEAAVTGNEPTGREGVYTEEGQLAFEEEEKEEQTISRSEVVAAPQAAGARPFLSGISRRKLALVVLIIVLLTLSSLAGYLITGRNKATDSKAIDSVAVMPLVNAGGDPNTEYLSDGMSETLINSLTELPQLRVIARTTAFRYKGKDVDAQQIGRELNVRAVLMGRVRQMGDALNVQVDLVDAATGAQLWGEEYERKFSDVLSVKQAIAREVTEKLRLRLSGEQQARLVKRDMTNAEAYQFYLRGRHYWNRRTADGIRKAIEQFQHATDLDPNYALGYVGLADCYVALEEYAGVPATETLLKAKAAAERALQLDDSLAEAHTSLAVTYRNQWRWAEAEEEYRRAITLNPNYPTGHQWLAFYFIIKRQFEDALREAKLAQELDPLSPIINDQVALIYLLKNDLNSVVEQGQRNIELNPGFPGTHYLLGSAHLKQRRYEDASAEFQKAVELSGKASVWLSPLGYYYAITGRRAQALRIVKELEERYARREALGQHIARVYAGLGEKDQVFAWLEKDFEQRSGGLPLITSHYSYEHLKSDSRYTDLVRRMGLQP